MTQAANDSQRREGVHLIGKEGRRFKVGGGRLGGQTGVLRAITWSGFGRCYGHIEVEAHATPQPVRAELLTPVVR